MIKQNSKNTLQVKDKYGILFSLSLITVTAPVRFADFLHLKFSLIGLLHLFKAEFVARSIRRTKAEYIRTNKASRLLAVVEALSHPLGIGNSNLLITNKRPSTMLFKFILLDASRLKISLYAKTEAEARVLISNNSPLVCYARFKEVTYA